MSAVERSISTTPSLQQKCCSWNPTTQLVALIAAPILAGAIGFGIGIATMTGAAIGLAVLSGSLTLLVVANLIRWIKAPTASDKKVSQITPHKPVAAAPSSSESERSVMENLQAALKLSKEDAVLYPITEMRALLNPIKVTKAILSEWIAILSEAAFAAKYNNGIQPWVTELIEKIPAKELTRNPEILCLTLNHNMVRISTILDLIALGAAMDSKFFELLITKKAAKDGAFLKNIVYITDRKLDLAKVALEYINDCSLDEYWDFAEEAVVKVFAWIHAQGVRDFSTLNKVKILNEVKKSSIRIALTPYGVFIN